MNPEEIMQSGLLYNSASPELLEKQAKARQLNFEFNQISPMDTAAKEAKMKEMFASVGEGTHIEAPFNANWGGRYTHLGKKVYLNFNTTLVDDHEIYIGDNTKFGPNVTVVTGNHPTEPEIRSKGYQWNESVRVGKNCWIGTNAVIMPGVTIGDNTIIGANSTVTKDIPANVIAFGSPCRVFREITEADKVDPSRVYKED